MYQFGERVLTTLAVHMDPAAEFRPPAVWVNDEIQTDLTWDFEEPSDRTGYVRAVQHIDQYSVRHDQPWLFKFDVEWRMSVWPQWVLAAQLADPRLVAKVQSQRNYMTEATITWGAWPTGEMPTDALISFPQDWPRLEAR